MQKLFLIILASTFLLNVAYAQERPNVLIVYVDDMGYGDLSCFGNPDVKTPNMDRLAKEGMKVTNYYSNSPICSPSRVALNTGQAPGRHKVWGHFSYKKSNKQKNMCDYLDPKVQTIAKVLKANGYKTGHFGKWHMGGGRDVVAPLPQAYGVDESLVSFEGLGERIVFDKTGLSGLSIKLGHGKATVVGKQEATRIYVDRAIDFMERHRNEPFYLHVFPNDVHDPHVANKENLAKFKSFSKNPYVQKFYATLYNMDVQIGRLLDAVDELQLSENTIVILTSDNGPTDWPAYYKKGFDPPGLTGPLYGRKFSLYEGGIRMPLLVRWPNHIEAGKVNETMVMQAVDFFPTILSMTGCENPAGWKLDGEDVSGAFAGKIEQRKRPLFWEYGSNPGTLWPGKKEYASPTNAMRDGDWKLLCNDDGSKLKLFNLAKDIGETTNLAKKYPERAQRMKQQLLKWRAGL